MGQMGFIYLIAKWDGILVWRRVAAVTAEGLVLRVSLAVGSDAEASPP
jgi:hypothetical protein